MNIALIFAGGTGKRMNTRSVPKQFLKIHGKPVLIYTLEKFQANKNVDGIVLVNLDEWIDYAKQMVKDYHITKILDIVSGGETGQESIFRGIKAARNISLSADDIILIHDGVRPLIDDKTITKCIETVQKKGSAITTAPAIETILANSVEDRVGEILNRAECLMARAPQCFFLNEIYQAHLMARTEKKYDFIDSATLMKYYGAKLFTVEGPIENIKITTPTDFYLFKALLDAQENYQVIGL